VGHKYPEQLQSAPLLNRTLICPPYECIPPVIIIKIDEVAEKSPQQQLKVT
jgi:hypothetical protein